MANGYFERGEIYWVRVDTGFGTETGVGRPALIISNDRANSACGSVIMAWLTTQRQDGQWDIYTEVTGKKSWILTNQIVTVDKNRLGKILGVLPPEDMRKVEDALEDKFDLGYNDDAALKEKEIEIAALRAEKADLKSEVARLKAQLEQRDDSKVIELAMYQRLYEKTLNTLVDRKFTSDVELRGAKKPEQKKPVEEPKPGEPKVEAPVEDTGLVDVNSATFTDLKKCGLSSNMVLTVIDRRPYKTLDDVKKLPGITNVMWQILSKKICCEPVAVEKPKVTVAPVQDEKLNINALSARDICEKLGIAKSTAFCIVSCRKQNGPFKKLEDMLNAKQVFSGTLEKIRDKIVFGPGIEEQAVSADKYNHKNAPDLTKYAGNKVNINTATAKEINEKTGLTLTVCYSIVGCRKRDGNYRSVEDLENVPRFTEYHMKYYAPMFEV